MTDPTPPADAPAPPPAPLDPEAMLRSRGFVVLLVFAAVIGLFVSLASWGFLELVHQLQLTVFSDLPDALGWSTMPAWWPIPILVLAGIPVAFAIVKLPGQGGHIPAHGLQVGSTEPNAVPGVALAAFATLGLGLVLGPEAPLIAIGGGLAVFAVKLAKRDAPPQLLLVLAAAGSFAAISVIFGSPIVAAVLVIEASGLGGATLPLILVPGLIAAGVGSLVFIGISNWTALSTSAYSLQPLQLPHFAHPTWGQIGWSLALGAVGALLTFVIRQLGLKGIVLAQKNHWLWLPAAGLVVGLLALLFASTTTHGVQEVIFSGQDQLSGTRRQRERVDDRRAALPALVQGAGVERVSRHLPRRPDVPGDLPRRGGWSRRVAPPGDVTHARGRGRHGGDGGVVPEVAALRGDHRHVAHRQRGPRGEPADHHRGGRGLSRDARARRTPRDRGPGHGPGYGLTISIIAPLRSTESLSSA